MKVNLAQELRDVSGKPILTPPGPAGSEPEPVTVRYACTGALLAVGPRERDQTLDQKMRRHRLAKTIEGAEDYVELSAEDVVLLKECANTAWPTAVLGPLVDAIDPPGGAPAA